MAVTAAPASAAQFYVTYTGTITSLISNKGGAFGEAPQGGLTGAGFTAVYTLTLPTAGATTTSDAEAIGASGSGGANPVRGAITINGVTQQFGQASGSAYLRNSPGLVDTIQFAAYNSRNDAVQTATDSLIMPVSSFTRDFVTALDFGQPFTYTTQAGDQADTALVISRYLFATAQATDFTAALHIATVTVSDISPAPEPASWAMMLVGFALVGGAIRRRRADQAADWAD